MRWCNISLEIFFYISHCIKYMKQQEQNYYPDTRQSHNHNCMVSNITFSNNHVPEKKIVYLLFILPLLVDRH